MDKRDPTADIDFPTLECFELVIASAARFVAEHANEKASSSCAVS